MPLPSGAHYEDRSRRTVQLSDGTVVKRQEAMNVGARENGFRNDRSYRAAREELRSIKGSSRYQRDVEKIRERNPGIKQRDIDRVLLKDVQERKRGLTGNRRARNPGSFVQEWNDLMGRTPANDWVNY